MDLRRLAYFVAVAEELHFGRAARRLSITQPGLSQQVQVLEREVGARLLDRDSRGVRLTAAGRALLAEAQPLLRRVDEIEHRLHQVEEGQAGELRLVHTRSASEPAHTILQDYRRRFPGVEVRVHSAWTSRNLEMLRADEVDVAFVRLPLPPHDADVEVLQVAEVELAVALPADHPLAARRRVAREDLVDQPVVHWARSQAPGQWDSIRSQVWGEHEPRVVREEPEGAVILTSVAAGVGVAVLDAGRIRGLRAHGVVLRRFAAPAPTTGVGVAWLPGRHHPAREQFVALCRAAAP